MLLFWICSALLTMITVLLIARPLRAATAEPLPPHEAIDDGADVAVYRDQLEEVEGDLARGLISTAEAEAARIEIARRLLAAAESKSATPHVSARPATDVVWNANRLFAALAALVMIVAVGLYAPNGSPNQAGSSVAARLAKAPSANADIEELIARVEARLRENPSDGQGWEVIAPVYLRLERFSDAADAFRRAISIMGETPRRLAGLAESIVLANDGVVTEEARKAYVRLLEIEPGRMEARFGLAMAMEQDGDIAGAMKAYSSILAKSPPEAPWRPFINERLEALAAKGGAASQGRGPAPPPGTAEAIASLPEADRRAVIQQMVEGLARRLEANGRDPDGWQRLIRAWNVLGDTAQAEAALQRARRALAGDDKALSAIDALARQLGLKS